MNQGRRREETKRVLSSRITALNVFTACLPYRKTSCRVRRTSRVLGVRSKQTNISRKLALIRTTTPAMLPVCSFLPFFTQSHGPAALTHMPSPLGYTTDNTISGHAKLSTAFHADPATIPYNVAVCCLLDHEHSRCLQITENAIARESYPAQEAY